MLHRLGELDELPIDRLGVVRMRRQGAHARDHARLLRRSSIGLTGRALGRRDPTASDRGAGGSDATIASRVAAAFGSVLAGSPANARARSSQPSASRATSQSSTRCAPARLARPAAGRPCSRSGRVRCARSPRAQPMRASAVSLSTRVGPAVEQALRGRRDCRRTASIAACGKRARATRSRCPPAFTAMRTPGVVERLDRGEAASRRPRDQRARTDARVRPRVTADQGAVGAAWSRRPWRRRTRRAASPRRGRARRSATNSTRMPEVAREPVGDVDVESLPARRRWSMLKGA